MRVVHDDVVVRVHHEAEALGVGVRHTEGLSDEIAVSLRNVGAAFIPVKLDRELLRKDWGREDVAEDPTTRKSVGEIEQSVGGVEALHCAKHHRGTRRKPQFAQVHGHVGVTRAFDEREGPEWRAAAWCSAVERRLELWTPHVDVDGVHAGAASRVGSGSPTVIPPADPPVSCAVKVKSSRLLRSGMGMILTVAYVARRSSAIKADEIISVRFRLLFVA